ncbi:MAG: tetratricopeptide repeat protein [Helicobacteraceae bacterium]|nr:tetratricopeptide repeat protein [Helicobacteraceae bacterium]
MGFKLKWLRAVNKIVDWTQAIKFDLKDAEAYYKRGLANERLGDYDKALADYTRAIKLDPSLSAAYAGRGCAYRTLGDRGKALADYTWAIKLDKLRERLQ